MSALSFYTKKLARLRTARLAGTPAPHKPVLLLSIITGIDKGDITENRIVITPELVATFKDLWHQLVHNTAFTANFALPFYHLKSDGFWHLHTRPGREILLTASHSIKSFAHLKEVVAYASFTDDLFSLLSNQHTREVLRHILLSAYFPEARQLTEENSIIATITNQILNEPPTAYKAKAVSFDEEEIFIRGGVFKKEIPRMYNYTCCISGLRIITDKNVQMIDACHIVPFAESGDDTITNGLSLCPNLHRAFDRGLIAISNDYRVLVKPFHESNTNVYSIKQFADKKLLLPKEKRFHPLVDNLAKHRKRFEFENQP
jgi:putative restriction endonuclease